MSGRSTCGLVPSRSMRRRGRPQVLHPRRRCQLRWRRRPAVSTNTHAFAATRHGTGDAVSDFNAIGAVSTTLQTLLVDRMELPEWLTAVPVTIGQPAFSSKD